MCNIFLEHIKIIDPHKSITDVVMFDGASNVQLAGELFKIHYPKITVMRGVEQTVSLFFNDVSKIPVVNQIIIAHKAIYNLFGSSAIVLNSSEETLARSAFIVRKYLCIPMK